jgi:hypothetical protein
MITFNYTPEQKLEILKKYGYQFKEIEKWFTNSSYHQQVETYYCKVLHPYKEESELESKRIYIAFHNEDYYDEINELFDIEMSNLLASLVLDKTKTK